MATADVVIVDDEAGIRDLVAAILADEGYHVETAPDGARALALLEQVSPRVILLDLHMPVMNGVEFIKRYRTRPRPHARIIVASSAPQSDHWCQVDGQWVKVDADDFIGKPFDLDALINLVRQHVAPGPGVDLSRQVVEPR